MFRVFVISTLIYSSQAQAPCSSTNSIQPTKAKIKAMYNKAMYNAAGDCNADGSMTICGDTTLWDTVSEQCVVKANWPSASTNSIQPTKAKIKAMYNAAGDCNADGSMTICGDTTLWDTVSEQCVVKANWPSASATCCPPFEFGGAAGWCTNWDARDCCSENVGFYNGPNVEGVLKMMNDGITGFNPTYNDGVVPWSAYGCIGNELNPYSNDYTSTADVHSLTGTNSDLTGTIAVVYRGDCWFIHKTWVAEQLGAKAVIIISHTEESTVMGSSSGDEPPNVSIPVIFLTKSDGEKLTNAMAKEDVIMSIGTTVEPVSCFTC